MRIFIINGPNLNLLGLREPELYGATTYESLCRSLKVYAQSLGVEVETLQSNHEGDLVDEIQRAYFDADGIVINPGAYTHTSVALLDALKAVRKPAVEVHVTDPDTREDFRKISYIRPACVATIKGRGVQGYFDALDLLKSYIEEHES